MPRIQQHRIGIPGPPGEGVNAAEWTATKAAATVLSALRFDPAHPNYGAVRGTGVSSAQRTANTAAINLAAEDARSAGGTLVLKGTYETDGTVAFACHVDAASATIRVVNTTINPAVRYGVTTPGTVVTDKLAYLPAVLQAGREVGSGWGGADVGVEISNVYHCNIFVNLVGQFSTNLKVTATGTGSAYSNIYLSHLQNGKVNLLIAPGTGGWANENKYYGGRLSHHASEGTAVSGVRHIQIPDHTNDVNNNRFFGTSVEGDTAEYHVECYGHANIFDQLRWEATAPKVRFVGVAAINNVLWYGYQSDTVTVTEESGAINNHRYSIHGIRMHPNAGTKGTMIGSNRGSTLFPVFSVMDATATHATDPAAYRWAVSAAYSYFKSASDTEPRLRIRHDNGKLEWGPGFTTVPDVGLGRGGVNLLTMDPGDYFRVGSVASLPTASATYRGYAIRIEGGTGVADGTYICRKNAADAYEWVNLTP